MPVPQNWQALQTIPKRIPGIFDDDTPKGIEGIPARLKMPRSAHRRAAG
jgi:hypothetical protein